MNSISVFVSAFDLEMLENIGVKHVWNYRRDGNTACSGGLWLFATIFRKLILCTGVTRI